MTQRDAPIDRAEAGDDRPRVHFDHHASEFGESCWAQYDMLREECPVAYSDTFGGFWLLSKYDDVRAVALDDRAFSSAQSVTVPPKPPGARHSIPIEVDPPLFGEYRRALNPWFSPAAAARLEPTIVAFVSALIDEFIERGRCDIVTELANPLAAMTTLAMLGLDPSDWEIYAVPVHAKTFLRPEKTKTPEFSQLYDETHRRVRNEIQSRRDEPRDDMITSLLQMRIAGSPISDDDLQDILMLVLHGGFDTTGSAIGNAMIYMDQHHDLRERLRANPALWPSAVEEFLRYQAPQPGLARVATEDRVIRGQHITKGDRLLLLWASANRDGDAFEHADEVVPDRDPNRHLTFGIGLHRCVGAPIASTEIRVALEAIVRRLPDYRVETESIVPAETVGLVFGHFSIPITFTPGRREGANVEAALRPG